MTPLDGVFVLDLSRILSGPICTMSLARHGRASRQSRAAAPWRRHTAVGTAVSRRHEHLFPVHQSQQAKPGARPEIAQRGAISCGSSSIAPTCSSRTSGQACWRGWASGSSAVAERNSRLIYCSISGFGQTGPDSNRPGYDVVAQGESGLMDLTGYPDRPPAKLGSSLADIIAGLYAVNGILLALLARQKYRQRAGDRHFAARQSRVDADLSGDDLLCDRPFPQRMGTRHPSIVPYECFQAKRRIHQYRRGQREAVGEPLPLAWTSRGSPPILDSTRWPPGLPTTTN